ncbi:hypothetical protein [Enterococcus hirae]|uniref:hypothetical protein n=1 Tax=Enterococcus hirae TaxID=1354 RepID=UPI002DBAF9CB|nr:hypothetical protein [Enterococcus hirae]MEB5878567.1 hypothetical protein [Enterococcus hirae]MEB5905553.1 hypothetical protein [Enterococcus hirae]
MKYRKKPVVIEAFKLNSRGLIGEEWFWDAVSENRIIIYNFGKNYPQDAWCEIKTLEGIMVAKTGDYIIRGVEGEIYPCKPDIFEKTYEVASQQSQLDDNQKIVLEWLKSNRNSLKVPMLAFYELAELADENTNLAYHQLDSKQEIEVLAAFAQWGLGQEEAEWKYQLKH